MMFTTLRPNLIIRRKKIGRSKGGKYPKPFKFSIIELWHKVINSPAEFAFPCALCVQWVNVKFHVNANVNNSITVVIRASSSSSFSSWVSSSNEFEASNLGMVSWDKT